MVNNKQIVLQLVKWLRDRKGGGCSTREIGQFYEAHPTLQKRHPSLRALCRKSLGKLAYRLHGNDPWIEAQVKPEDEGSSDNELLEEIGVAPFDQQQAITSLWFFEPSISESSVDQAKCDMDQDVTTLKNMTNSMRFHLIKESKKGIARRNKLQLREDKEKIQRLLDSDQPLQQMAKDLNITTTDLAIEIVGWELLDEQIQAAVPMKDNMSPLEARKRALLRQARLLASSDTLTGYKISKHNRVNMKKSSEKQEHMLQKRLKENLRLQDENFITEAEIKSGISEGNPLPPTPDVLLLAPLLVNGHECHWIELKHSVLVPGLSSDDMLQSVKQQTESYFDAYGPGMVLWTKYGFCQDMVEFLGEHVLNAVPRDVHMKTLNMQQRNVEYRGYQPASNFFTPRAASLQSLFGFDQLLHMGPGPMIGSFPPRHMHLPEWSIGQRLGGENAADPRQARLEYLERIEESERAARLSAMMAQLDEEEDSLTALLRAMFAPDESEEQETVVDTAAARVKIVAEVDYLCRMLSLTDQGGAALVFLGKIIRNILAHPDEEKYRSVNLAKAPALADNTRALRVAHLLGFETDATGGSRLTCAASTVDAELWQSVHSVVTKVRLVPPAPTPEPPTTEAVGLPPLEQHAGGEGLACI